MLHEVRVNKSKMRFINLKYISVMSAYMLGLMRTKVVTGIKTKVAGTKFVPPNYAFFDIFQPGDVAIDVGIGDDPDFSKYLMTNYGMESFGVDPTRKHAHALQCLEKTTPEFHYLPYALGRKDGDITFFESNISVSGSILARHINIVNDPHVSYPVQMVTLDTLLKLVNRSHIAIIKIDIEGCEYELIDHLEGEILKAISQLIIEFHHNTVKDYTFKDTLQAIEKIKSFGMKSLLYNGRDCLFYW